MRQGHLRQKEAAYGEEIMRQLERYAVLSTIDRHWRDHLSEMDELRTGIGLRAYHGGMGQPIDIYKKEAFGMFEQMIDADRSGNRQSGLQAAGEHPREIASRTATRTRPMAASHAESTGMG